MYVLLIGRRNVQDLRVKCGNRRCRWKGTVATLAYHSTKCWFTLLPCPKECKDDYGEINCFIRKNLDEHLQEDCPNRDYECEHCGEEGTYAEITEVHDDICEFKLVYCPNDECPSVMQRQEVDEHVKSECEYTMTPCKYESIGCSVKMKRQDMEKHEQKDKQGHLNMAMDTTLQLKKELLMIKEKERTLNDKAITLKMTGCRAKKNGEKTFRFPTYYTHPCGYNMCLAVFANGRSNGHGTHISAGTCIVAGNYDSEVKWPFMGDVTIKLLNQLEDKNHHVKTVHITEKENAKVGDNWGYRKFIAHPELGHIPIMNRQYLKDDTLYFRLSVTVANHKPWLDCAAN